MQLVDSAQVIENLSPIGDIPQNEAQGLHLPNTWNCIQSAIYQLEQQNNPASAIAALKAAQKSLRPLLRRQL